MTLQVTAPLALQLGILANRLDSGKTLRVRVRVQGGRTIPVTFAVVPLLRRASTRLRRWHEVYAAEST